MRHTLVSTILGLIGGVAGGILGYYAFFWIVSQGLYGLIIPGAFVGLGCGLLARHRSMVRGVLCAVAAVALGLYAEWKFAPFVKDGSFRYLLTHVHELKPVTLMMIAVGGFLAFWIGKDAGFTFRGISEKPDAGSEPSGRLPS